MSVQRLQNYNSKSQLAPKYSPVAQCLSNTGLLAFTGSPSISKRYLGSIYSTLQIESYCTLSCTVTS